MIFNIDHLKRVLDGARNDPALQTIKNKDGSKTTFCNLNAFRVSQDLGFNHFWNDEQDRPGLATEDIISMENNPHQFSKFYSPVVAWNLVNAGYLIYATEIDTPHSHIVPLYPSVGMVTSGNMKCAVPYCSEVVTGKVQGINFSFKELPTFFLCIS